MLAGMISCICWCCSRSEGTSVWKHRWISSVWCSAVCFVVDLMQHSSLLISFKFSRLTSNRTGSAISLLSFAAPVDYFFSVFLFPGQSASWTAGCLERSFTPVFSSWSYIFYRLRITKISAASLAERGDRIQLSVLFLLLEEFVVEALNPSGHLRTLT